MMLGRLFLLFCATLAVAVSALPAEAQITPRRPSGGSQVATLEEQLINRLRATTDDRQLYIRIVVARVEQGVLDRGRVLALERYAIRKNPQFPFPYFERTMRLEAERNGVYLPPVRLLAGPKFQTLK